MDSQPPRGTDGSSDVLVEIVETLEANGLPKDSYQLHDSIDVEALERLISSSAGDVEVRFTVEGIRLAVTKDGVDVMFGDPVSSPERYNSR